jgi:hypothetical protein
MEGREVISIDNVHAPRVLITNFRLAHLRVQPYLRSPSAEHKLTRCVPHHIACEDVRCTVALNVAFNSCIFEVMVPLDELTQLTSCKTPDFSSLYGIAHSLRWQIYHARAWLYYHWGRCVSQYGDVIAGWAVYSASALAADLTSGWAENVPVIEQQRGKILLSQSHLWCFKCEIRVAIVQMQGFSEAHVSAPAKGRLRASRVCRGCCVNCNEVIELLD